MGCMWRVSARRSLAGDHAKKTSTRAGAFAVAATAAMALAACGSGTASGSSSASSSNTAGTATSSGAAATAAAAGKCTHQYASKHWTIGFTNPQGAQPILNLFQQALKARTECVGIKLISLDDQLNPDKQVSDINQLVSQHVNAIITFPLSPGTLRAPLTAARKAGIKVLGFNAVVKPKEPTGSIAPYNADFNQGEDYQGASMLAKYVAQQLHGKGNVLGVVIQTPVPSLHFMVQQYQTYLKRYAPNIHWLETVSNASDDTAGGQTAVATALSKYHNNIQAVMGYNDDSAIGASLAEKSAGLNNVINVGMNGDPQGVTAIKNGQMSAMIDIVPWRQALIATELSVKLMTGKTVPTVTHTPVEMYTKKNISKRLDWNAAVKQIGQGTLTCANGGC